MERVEYGYPAGMTEAEVERRLRESHAGVLALASDFDAWSIVARVPVGPAPADDAEVFNQPFEPFRTFDESVDDVDLSAWEMGIETLSGQRTVA